MNSRHADAEGLGDTALIDLVLSIAQSSNEFYLSQTDPDSAEDPNTIFFSSTLDIIRSGPVSAPATLLLMGLGLAGIGYGRRCSEKTA